jgi:hypothetical protein
MMSSVPQFIDVEDKIAGPLTWKQLGWMIAMGAVIFICFSIFDTTLTIIVSIPVVMLFVALAFYRPNGFSMISFLGSGVFFLFRPKLAVWERPAAPVVSSKAETEPKVTVAPVQDKHMTREKLAELARTIDSKD